MEWNSGMYDGIRLDEILQIGAVKADRPGGRVESSLNLFIRPRVHRRYSPAAAELPELDEALRSQLDFPTAAQLFFDWCGEDRVFAAWGTSDFMVLRQNLEYWHLRQHMPETFLDLQAAFGLKLGTGMNLSLEWAVEYCRVPDVFDPHNALSDAIYAWAVCDGVEDGLIQQGRWVPGPPKPKQLARRLPRRETPWRGPFRTLEELLSNRGCRHAPCPVCQEKGSVSRWYARSDRGPFYAPFTCPQHGGKIWRLEVARDKSGQLWANGRALEPSPGAQEALALAKAGKSYSCRSRRRKRGRRRARSDRAVVSSAVGPKRGQKQAGAASGILPESEGNRALRTGEA